ncbi:response regulator transcription factor [Streptosporangium algeriense]|uniref:Response regulator transcription factor n=1 Tax=Streptosporangium algeriense TaxID=1682748 RepID=A0ABW3DXY8_9ACTN
MKAPTAPGKPFGVLKRSGVRTSVLLADRDPVSRHAICVALRAADQIVTGVDAQRPLREWPLDQADVLLWATSPGDDVARRVSALVESAIPVLLLSVRWSREDLDAALAAGAAGFLTKDTPLDRLVAATHAAAAGFAVFTPELLGLAFPGRRRARPSGSPQSTVDTAEADATMRRIEGLSVREFEIIAMLARGHTTAEISESFNISPATVKSHISHALKKLEVRNRVEAVLLFQRAASSRGVGLRRGRVERLRRDALDVTSKTSA